MLLFNDQSIDNKNIYSIETVKKEEEGIIQQTLCCLKKIDSIYTIIYDEVEKLFSDYNYITFAKKLVMKPKGCSFLKTFM